MLKANNGKRLHFNIKYFNRNFICILVSLIILRNDHDYIGWYIEYIILANNYIPLINLSTF